MKYEKPAAKAIVFDENREFLVYSGNPSSQNPEQDAKNAAIAAMGWGKWDGVTAQKGADGKWMAFCTLVNGQTYSSGQCTCTKF